MKKITMRMNKDISLNDAFTMFQKRCISKNLSEQTIKTYQIRYRIFITYFGDSFEISDINSNEIDNFIIYLKTEKECTDITINSYLSTIRAFLYYLMEQNLLPSFKIPKIKTDKKLKEVYSDSDLRLLLKKPDTKTCNFVEYRMWVFSNFFLGTGMRLSSALNIMIQDIDFDNNLINITKTKSRKAQIIPLSYTLSNILMEYLQYRGGSSTDYLFCNVEGNKSANRSYQDALNDYNRNRGVTKTGAHRYRHPFAKNWILNGGDIFRLQKILGHSDLTVVKEYVQLYGNDLSIDFDKFNPLESFNVSSTKKHIRICYK